MEDKKRNLFIILSAFFVTNALVAEIIGSKIFSLEKSLGLTPSSELLFGVIPFQFNMTAGVLLWPFVFITTDIVNEYFGPVGVRRISLITVGCISYAFLMLFLAIKVSPADFWLGTFSKDSNGVPLNINYAYGAILGQGMNIIAASLITFLIGQILDAYIFQYIKKKTEGKLVWLRATGSTFVSQLLDSFVILFLAFYAFQPAASRWPISLVASIAIINYLYKLTMAVALTPLIYLAHNRINAYLGIRRQESGIS